MVTLQTIQQSNASVATLPPGLVALFIGATSGIGQSTLQHFAQHASSPRIYTVARPQTATSHEKFLASLRQSNPSSSYSLITADHTLVSDIDKVVAAIKEKETKLDILFMSTASFAFEERDNTAEGLDSNMATRYYTRLRAVQQLLPLLNNSASPRIVSVLGGGMETPLNEQDLDLREPGNWSFWNASLHSTTMGTLALEHFARQNPHLSVVHWFPGPVATPGLEKAKKFGLSQASNPISSDEAGESGLFLATSDRYAVQGGLVPAPEGVGAANKTGGGIFLVDPQGEIHDNEGVLAEMRKRGLGETVWTFTEEIFASCTA
ncbi:hypothetical protein QQZ08_010926 [Neonectria magnoliae]|uniref:Uncharacterized protein n=1 Tax=Neonectria magnoliae TaxID=2732573 RepID=A0ABR1HDH4_9HYPO